MPWPSSAYLNILHCRGQLQSLALLVWETLTRWSHPIIGLCLNPSASCLVPFAIDGKPSLFPPPPSSLVLQLLSPPPLLSCQLSAFLVPAREPSSQGSGTSRRKISRYLRDANGHVSRTARDPKIEFCSGSPSANEPCRYFRAPSIGISFLNRPLVQSLFP